MSEKTVTVGDYAYLRTATDDGDYLWDVWIDGAWEPIDDGKLEGCLDRIAELEAENRKLKAGLEYKNWHGERTTFDDGGEREASDE